MLKILYKTANVAELMKKKMRDVQIFKVDFRRTVRPWDTCGPSPDVYTGTGVESPY